MKPTTSWKKFELRVGRMLGGKRRGADYGGRQGGKCDLVPDPDLPQEARLFLPDGREFLDVAAPECKHLKKPTWGQLIDALNQSSNSTDATGGKFPVAIMKENHRGVPDRDAVVLMWLDDFVKLIERTENGKEEEHEANQPGTEGESEGPPWQV